MPSAEVFCVATTFRSSGPHSDDLRARLRPPIADRDFDTEIGGGSAAEKTSEKKDNRDNAHTILLCTRKRLKLTDRAGLLASRVRMITASGYAPAFPGSPSGRGQFPRLQLRGSAGFSPASLSSPSGKDARS